MVPTISEEDETTSETAKGDVGRVFGAFLAYRVAERPTILDVIGLRTCAVDRQPTEGVG